MAFPLFSIVGLPAQAANTLARVAEAVTGFQVLGSLAGGVIGSIMGTNTAIAVQAQAFVDALGSNDLMGAVSAIINTPAALVGAVLNGITDPTSNEFITGLLTVPSGPSGRTHLYPDGRDSQGNRRRARPARVGGSDGVRNNHGDD